MRIFPEIDINPMRIALVTAKAARDLDDDLPPLQSALAKKGADVVLADWDDADAPWETFDVALLRSTWDYTQRLPEFLDWVTRVSALTHLVNPLAVARWNTDKHYLHDLTSAGVNTVPSVFIEPEHDAGDGVHQFLAQHANAEFVVKPSVGAGSRDAQRYNRYQIDDAIRHVRRLLDDRRSALLQPYFDRVDEHGETALIYFAGEFSHAIRKGALLRPNEGSTRALFAAEHIGARKPNADEIFLAEKALSSIPFEKPLLYSRVDLIQDPNGAPALLELELTEPSLFFAFDQGAADRFAEAILHIRR